MIQWEASGPILPFSEQEPSSAKSKEEMNPKFEDVLVCFFVAVMDTQSVSEDLVCLAYTLRL